MIFTICQSVKLIHKFFLAFFITNISLVGLMFVFIYMTFSSGFNNFVEQEEKKHVAMVKQQLIEFYSELGSWQAIKQDTQLWRSIVEPQKKPGESKTNKPSSTSPKSNSSKVTPSLLWLHLPAGFLKTGQRISLYDQNKMVIVGRASLNDHPHIESILLNNNVIGWLGLVPSKLEQSSPTAAFLEAQFHNYFMITLLVITLAFIMAIALSRHLIKPIKRIVTGTNELTKGNFTCRITPSSKDELGTLSNNFNTLAHTLEQNQQMRFQWVSDTSHELRTPLTVLRSHLLALQDGVFTADTKRINLLLSQVDNLSHIVDDLAQLAQTDSVNLTYNNTPIDLINIVEQSIENYTARFKDRELNVDSTRLAKAGKCIIKGDKERLVQLFSNLLENTCRYTHKGGQVKILANKTPNNIELILQDSAPSVLPNDLHKLFERFYRVEKSRSREHGGSGLGLALCKQIVEAHGGQISLHNSPYGGLEVKITLKLLG